MTIEEAVYAALNANSAVNALVNGAIYPVMGLQDGPIPYIVYSITSTEPYVTQDDPIGTTKTYCFQFSCFSNQYSQARAVAQAVIAALCGYTGTPGFQAAVNGKSRTLWEDDTKYYHIPVEIEIMESLS